MHRPACMPAQTLTARFPEGCNRRGSCDCGVLRKCEAETYFLRQQQVWHATRTHYSSAAMCKASRSKFQYIHCSQQTIPDDTNFTMIVRGIYWAHPITWRREGARLKRKPGQVLCKRRSSGAVNLLPPLCNIVLHMREET